MAKVTKAVRLELLTTASSLASDVAAELDDRATSPDPIESARATAILIDARNKRDDLAASLALLKRRPAADLKPVSDADAQNLDELAAILEERTRRGNLASKTIAVLTEILRTADSVGQIIGERV